MPDSIPDLVWFVLNGLIFVVAALIAYFVRDMRSMLQSLIEAKDDHSRAIVEIQTRCEVKCGQAIKHRLAGEMR